MEKFIFEKREATSSEKATKHIFDLQRQEIFEPRYMGKEEVAWRLRSVADKNKILSMCFCYEKQRIYSGEIPRW